MGGSSPSVMPSSTDPQPDPQQLVLLVLTATEGGRFELVVTVTRTAETVPVSARYL